MENTLSKQTILIVDDAPENINMLHGILGSDFRVKFALNGEKALEIAFKNPPDLILLDIMMPGMDGYEVCRRLKSADATKKIPIIFVTAKAESKDEKRGFQLGAVAYIKKPFKDTIVRELVKAHL
ncbi:MAG: response regulator [Deltaproteobacteria bacterium]|nr:response regulator [Deltaproteobacteria bacterium]